MPPYTKKDILKQNQNDKSINMQQEHFEEITKNDLILNSTPENRL